MNPLVSVIVTSFNQSATIGQTLDSILSQQYGGPVEIVIGDDCSQDGTKEICLEYARRFPDIFTLRFSDVNEGVASNFARSVQGAKGTYVAICAADDYWHDKDKLQRQVDFLESHPDYGLVHTDYDKLNVRNGKTTKQFLLSSGVEVPEGSDLIQLIFSGRVPILTLTVMFRKQLFVEHIPADDYIRYQFPLEDWPTWLILSKHTKIGFLPVSTGTYRYGHESITNLYSFEKAERRLHKEHFMYDYLCKMFPDDITYNETEYLIYINKILLNLAYKKMDYPAARKYATELRKLRRDGIKVRATDNKLIFLMLASLKKLKGRLT